MHRPLQRTRVDSAHLNHSHVDLPPESETGGDQNYLKVILLHFRLHLLLDGHPHDILHRCIHQLLLHRLGHTPDATKSIHLPVHHDSHKQRHTSLLSD